MFGYCFYDIAPLPLTDDYLQAALSVLVQPHLSFHVQCMDYGEDTRTRHGDQVRRQREHRPNHVVEHDQPGCDTGGPTRRPSLRLWVNGAA